MDYGINILVVDDSRAMRMTIKVILKRLGFMNIVEAEDGRQGLDVLKTVHIDLILCDWMMPVMTGLEMLKELQKDPAQAKIPFVIVTAVGNKESIIEAVQAGVSNYIVKPFAPDTLEGKIKACFTNKNKLKLE
ncbi:MAG: response regulator [Desulfobacterales bacterium]|nr:response regulator [Desulfobacterales bacterium]MCP4159458.1 response regulator [Deltaproteobacteria bacterium]